MTTELEKAYSESENIKALTDFIYDDYKDSATKNDWIESGSIISMIEQNPEYVEPMIVLAKQLHKLGISTKELQESTKNIGAYEYSRRITKGGAQIVYSFDSEGRKTQLTLCSISEDNSKIVFFSTRAPQDERRTWSIKLPGEKTPTFSTDGRFKKKTQIADDVIRAWFEE